MLDAVRLYLSSFRLGDRVDDLLELVGAGRRAGVIANGLDGYDTERRREGLQLELETLSRIGFAVEEIDLRDHFDDPAGLAAALSGHDVVWVRGGNVFVLRYAMWRAGLDAVLRKLLTDDVIVYAGYSAGPCVLGPTIDGFARTDDPQDVDRAYGARPMTLGLGVLDFIVIPHVQSPDHPASPALTALADEYEASGERIVRLRDGEVLIIDEATEPAKGADAANWRHGPSESEGPCLQSESRALPAASQVRRSRRQRPDVSS